MLSLIPPPPKSTLFPYTTLFRSHAIPERQQQNRVIPAVRMGMSGHSKVHGRLGKNLGMTRQDRKSTRLNSSHVEISYAVFCLKKKKKNNKWQIMNIEYRCSGDIR